MVKLKIFFIIALLAGLGVVVVLYLKSKSENVNKSVVFPPKITNYVRGGFTVKTTLGAADFTFPATARLLELELGPQFSKDEAKAYAARFGFNEDPKEAPDVTEGTTYLWSNDQESLIIYSKSRKIQYSLQVLPQVINKQLSNEAITKTAQTFLQDRIFDKGALEVVGINFLKSQSQSSEGVVATTKSAASVYQVNFSPLASTKILTLDPNISPDYVWVLPDGKVFKSQTTIFITLKLGETEYPLKNFEQFTKELNKAVVVSLDDGNLNLPDLQTGTLEEVTINKVELIYLFESLKSTNLQPVFLLTGEAKIKDRPETVSVQLYLPALANLQP